MSLITISNLHIFNPFKNNRD